MYIPYKSISKKGDSSTYVPLELYEAQQEGLKTIPLFILDNWDTWLCEQLKFENVDKLWEVFSSEQLDSIGLSIFNFMNGKNFIIADETGIGKGRILSGICRWAMMQGKKVMFFTEREHLFTDFWRDLIDTRTIEVVSNPVIFHATSKVFNPDGEMVAKGTMKNIQKIQSFGFLPDTNLVLTNYSQISLEQHKKNKKNIMLDYCTNNILIIDESHNATGDSATNKFLTDLIKVSKHLVFSSATYLKDESQIDLYSHAIPFEQSTLDLFKKLLSGNRTLMLRKVFTYELTKMLLFWRREHEPLDVGWKSIVCDDFESQQFYIDKYSNIINKLFELSNALSKEPSLNELNLNGSWFMLGATINRLSRNLLLLLKIDKLVDSVKKTILENKKAVIVIDSTFASIINKVIDLQNNQTSDFNDNDDNEMVIDIDKPDYELNFKQVLYYIVEEVVGKYIKQYQSTIPDYFFEDYIELRKMSEIFENFSISPIDIIINKLKADGIESNEISGRTFKINEFNKIEKIQKVPKSKLVNEFNSGLKDVIIITRAGASGLSLHASAVFKDQRVRRLFELEITNRPTYRLQFIGRVNRKNQVAQPEFFTIVTNLPFEQRILNIEQQKLKKLQSHISGDDEKLSQENIHNFYTDYCDTAVYQYLKNNPQIAYQMGINLKDKQEPLYYVDSLLKRCIVLNSQQQNFLYDYLVYCTESELKLKIKNVIPKKITAGKIVTLWSELDVIGKQKFAIEYKDNIYSCINQFKYPWVGLMKITSSYQTNIVNSQILENELQNNLAKSNEILDFIKKVYSYHKNGKFYDSNYFKNVVEQRLSSLKLGKNIILSSIEGKIFGYIHDISYPKLKDNFKFDSLSLIHIKTLNPLFHKNIFYEPEDYYLTIKEFLEIDEVNIIDKPINFKQFDRENKDFEREQLCLIGHPIYMQFIKESYNLGDIKYLEIDKFKNMLVLIPQGISHEEILNFKKPIFKTNKIMEGLIAKQIKNLTTLPREDQYTKATLKIESVTGGYKFYIINELYKDNKFIDFPLKKKLYNTIGSMDGYQMFFIAYKEIRSLLFSLESRNVIWFVE